MTHDGRMRWRAGIDIGGTFTDFVLHDGQSDSLHLHKRLTTPHDPSEAALAGLAELLGDAGLSFADLDEIVHGTTLVTNAVIERKGATLGFLTTRGFRDMLEMGREQRYDIYDLFIEFPAPLAPRNLCLEIGERIDRDGGVVEAVTAEDIRRQLSALRAAGVEAVGVCLVNAFRNPAHEALIGSIARAEFPELAISLSHEVAAEISEYERAVTTCANAYVQPLIDAYLHRLESALAARGFAGRLHMMHSAGGLISLDAARAFPIRLLESGPAGGTLATALFGRLAGLDDVIAFDMGGTTAKASIIRDGAVDIAPMLEAGRVHRFAKGSGLPIKTPTVDLIEIGAGGGSIASIDEVGLLKVGPRSAGSAPGPACYGRGGTEPTVTDANLVLGYYDPGFFLGGKMELLPDRAAASMEALGARLGLSTAQTAWGIHKLVVENMAAAARVHLIEKGLDPRHHAMVGFGGAGPAHACNVARAIGVKEVIIPPASGAASALGFLTAPLSFELSLSCPSIFHDSMDFATVNGALARLEEEGHRRLVDAGIATGDIAVVRSADMRMVGQTHEIAVDLPDGAIGADAIAGIVERFRQAYSARYTSVPDQARVEAINFRVRCVGPVPALAFTLAAQAGDTGAARKGTRQAWFDKAYIETPVYDRYSLRPGEIVQGPAIIEEREATTVIAPGDRLEVDAHLNLRISIAAAVAAPVMITGELPLEEAMARIASDPISLEIMWSRLVTVTEEMWSTMCRTAFSLVVSDAQDFACELLDPRGEPIVHSPRAMPVFNLALPRAVQAILEHYPAETLVPGDVLITNDPWLCAGHLFDVAVVLPVFREGALVGLAATVAHVADIGGTKNPLASREVYEEGIQIPPSKLFEGGQPNDTLFRLIAQNVRAHEQVIGDLHAMIAANRIGADRLLDFMDDYGMADLRALTAVIQDRSEQAMREAIRAVPDGVYRGESWTCPMGEPLRIPVKMTVRDDEIELDFEGAPPQLKRGAFNSTLNYASSQATYPLKCLLTPQVRGNAGCYRPFRIKAPKGSILNCDYPAPVSQRTRSGWFIAPGIFRALSEALPDRVQAFTGLSVTPTIYGLDAAGRAYSDMFFSGGGQGASAQGDGKSGLLWPTSAANTSAELFETRVPVVVLERTYVQDSGGPGRFRGGLGQRIRIRKLYEDGCDMLASFFPDTVSQSGLFGGLAGLKGSGRLLDVAGTVLDECGTGHLLTLTGADQIIEITLAGGSGYGDPRQRDRGAIEADIAEGRVSPAAAERDYGFAAPADHAQTLEPAAS
jgi:5-oxoprolinase (ATP-hydrolysing)